MFYQEDAGSNLQELDLSEVQVRYEQYYERIKNQLGWEKILSVYSLRRKKRISRGWIAHCPLHDGKGASIQFYERSAHFKCYGCGAEGNMFHFIEMMEGSWLKAVRMIQKKFGIQPPFSSAEWLHLKGRLTRMGSGDFSFCYGQVQYNLTNGENERFINNLLSELDPDELVPSEEDKDEYELMMLKCGPIIAHLEVGKTIFENRDVVLEPAPVAIIEQPKTEIQYPQWEIGSLKRIYLIRHADYGDDVRISSKGKQQTAFLAENLKFLRDENCVIIGLCSEAPRAIDTAFELSAKMGLVFKSTRLLWSDAGHSWDTKAALEWILAECQGADVAVIISHLEYCEYLPQRIGKEIMGKEMTVKTIDKGSMCIIDFEKNEITYPEIEGLK